MMMTCPRSPLLISVLKILLILVPAVWITHSVFSDRLNSSQRGFRTTAFRPKKDDEKLATEVRVLCMILTGPKFHHTRSIHVKNTWGARCNQLLFVSSAADEELGTILLPNVSEGRNWLWAKTKEGFKYVWEHHRNDADWFLKADDNSYVLLDNLRRYLLDKNPAEPHYLGCRVTWRLKQGLNFGGSGYVLSKEALRHLIEDGLSDPQKCSQGHDGDEDGQLGKCMENLGIVPADTRDSLGRHQFMLSKPELHVNPASGKLEMKFFQSLFYPEKKGMDCCSDNPISFHAISPGQMYTLEYLIYHSRPRCSSQR